MAAVVVKLRATALGNIPTSGIPNIYYQDGFRNSGGTFLAAAKVNRISNTGGAIPFSNTNLNRIDQDSTNIITAGTVSIFDVFNVTPGDAPSADFVWFDSYSTAVDLYRLEFLAAGDIVVATYQAKTTNPDLVKLALGTPVTPAFWTGFKGASEYP